MTGDYTDETQVETPMATQGGQPDDNSPDNARWQFTWLCQMTIHLQCQMPIHVIMPDENSPDYARWQFTWQCHMTTPDDYDRWQSRLQPRLYYKLDYNQMATQMTMPDDNQFVAN
jgi:hypothetical protein